MAPTSGGSSWLDSDFMSSILRGVKTGGQYGTAGAMGRESSVQAMHRSAYDLGFSASREDFDGNVFRSVDSRHAPTMFEAQHGASGGGRYNASGQQLIYASPTFEENVGESSAYKGMANRTMVEANYQTGVDPTTGQGGLADITTAATERRGLFSMTNALTTEVGEKQYPSGLWKLFGEHPYSQTQQVGKGANDVGAGAIRVPSATGGDQIDIIPRNNPANAITPLDVTPFDAHGNPGASTPAVTTILGMGVDTSPHTPGPIPLEPGTQIRPPTPAEPIPPGRAGSMRYGALGGGLTVLGTDLYRMAKGENVGIGQTLADTGVGTGAGAGSAMAADALMATGRGATSAGGIVGGVIEGGMSAWNNAHAYSNGQISRNQAIANTVVDTGVGVGAGMAGAAMGAAIGSIIPGAGTLVGAGLGFLGGMAGSYIAHALAEKTGAADYAKEKLGASLGRAADGISSADSAIGSDLSTAGSAITGGANRAWNALTNR